MGWTKFVDLQVDPEEHLIGNMPEGKPPPPHYPYGLRLCLTHVELEKLGLEADCDVGDIIDLRAFGEVTSITKEGEHCRIEIQIQKLAVENESEEDEAEGDEIEEE